MTANFQAFQRPDFMHMSKSTERRSQIAANITGGARDQRTKQDWCANC